MDVQAYYDPPSSPSDSSMLSTSPPPPAYNLRTNSGNKLDIGARFMRNGKLYAWSHAFEDVTRERRARSRLRDVLEQIMPDAAAEVGAPLPANLVNRKRRREKRKREREEDEKWLLPHLIRSPSPPASTTRLTSLLAVPTTYVELMMNDALAHSLGDDTMERGLQRTASELLEGERGLAHSLGRLQEVLRVHSRESITEREANGNADTQVPNGHELGLEVREAAPEANGTTQAEESTTDPNLILPLPHISDTDNLWRVTQELLNHHPQPEISYTPTPPGAAVAAAPSSPEPVITPLHRLFTHPDGLTLNSKPSANHPGLSLPADHAMRPKHIKYNLNLATQCRAVDDAIERIMELFSDCKEYERRLEEARQRVADVARLRKRVWGIVKERAQKEVDAARSR